jgi:uncharacterized protein YvpB
MTNLWKYAKYTGLISIVLGLILTSAIFTVLLYAKITGKEPYSQNFETVNAYTEITDLDENVKNEETESNTLALEPEIVHKTAARVSVPLILQYPELPRGCELTSLTMLMQYYGIKKSKMDLLPEMKRDSTEVQYDKDGTISFWGHPNVGFVGDITLNSVGFGIYHAPLYDLLESYIPTALDLTGSSFRDLELQLSQDIPVVVWTTVTYKEPSSWIEWDTPIGPIRTTIQEHAVIMVGYDEQYVYINDPLKETKDIKIDKKQFISTWETMGKQALSYNQDI